MRIFSRAIKIAPLSPYELDTLQKDNINNYIEQYELLMSFIIDITTKYETDIKLNKELNKYIIEQTKKYESKLRSKLAEFYNTNLKIIKNLNEYKVIENITLTTLTTKYKPDYLVTDINNKNPLIEKYKSAITLFTEIYTICKTFKKSPQQPVSGGAKKPVPKKPVVVKKPVPKNQL